MNNNKSNLAFEKRNYILMIIGLCVLIIGFVLMTMDKQPFGFGFLGITLGPIVVMSGFIIEFFAILYKTKEE